MSITITQADLRQGDISATSQLISISVRSNDNARIGCAIAAQLAQHGIPVAFAMARPCGREYEGVFGFESQQDADRAIRLIEGLDESKVRRLRVA